MMILVFFAMLNGICIGISRVMIGRLGMEIGHFKASFWSYLVGFLFVTLMLVVMGHLQLIESAHAPLWAYLGGFFGAIYVVINSYVFTKIGSIKSVLLIISGQMISGIFLDYHSGSVKSTWADLLGLALILIGIYFAKKQATPPSITDKKSYTPDIHLSNESAT